MNLEMLITDIQSLGDLVKFQPVSAQHPLRKTMPEHARAFDSGYAWLVVWPVSETSAEALLAADHAAEDLFIQAFPPEAGQSGSVIDGYVVLALPSRPPTSLAEVRHVRLARSVCRRSVVWWDDGKGRWMDVDTITVVGIAGIGGGQGPNAGPGLSEGESAFVGRISTEGGAAAARADLKEAGL